MTTFVIKSVTKALAAAGNYGAEDVLSESATVGTVWTFDPMVTSEGASGVIVKAQAIWETTALTPALTIFLFNRTPTSAVNDNVANTALLHADLANYVGRIDFPALADIGGDSEAIVTGSGNLPLPFSTVAGDRSLYGIVVTNDAITGEAATDELTIVLTSEQS